MIIINDEPVPAPIQASTDRDYSLAQERDERSTFTYDVVYPDLDRNYDGL